MEVIVLPTGDEVGAMAAKIIARLVESQPRAVLGLATGSSPLAIYADLAGRVASGELDFSAVRGFALDEYVGLSPAHPQSYASVLRAEVTEPLGLDPANLLVPDGMANDVEAACAAYESAIAAAGGIDLQLLGIGVNGHIGFNEPTSSLASRTRIKTLTARTRSDNARFFESLDEVPTHCLTQGLGTIRDAARLVLVAKGPEKATAIAKIVEGPVSSRWPGSVLQLHQHATVIVDEAAASDLELVDYYRLAFAAKPDWQS